MTTTLYFVASQEDAWMILAEGFRDAPSDWIDLQDVGVYLTDFPLDPTVGTPDDWESVLEVQFKMTEEEIAQWRCEMDPARGISAWLVPAKVVNNRGRTRLLKHTATEFLLDPLTNPDAEEEPEEWS